MVKEISWGYVRRVSDPSEILIATRQKRSDPDQYGKYVIPGGGVKPIDTDRVATGIRETKEETDIDAIPIIGYQFPAEPRKIDNSALMGR